MNKKDLRNISLTNWQALDSMSDEDIDYSDIPPLTDEFFAKATLQIPAAQAKVELHTHSINFCFGLTSKYNCER